MRHKSLQFQISSLQHAKLITLVEAVAVVIFALFVSAILPSLLVRYVYATQQLMEQPKILEMIPVIAFVIGSGFGLYALVINFMRSRKIKALMAELAEEELLGDSCCGGSCGCGDDWDDLSELDEMVDQVMAETEKKASKATVSKAPARKKTTSAKK